jgi:hypothetical protein
MPATLSISDRQLAISATEGIRHFEAADWSLSARPTEEFLATLALRLVLAGYLVGSVDKLVGADGATSMTVEIDGQSAPGERQQAAKMLVAPLGAYVQLANLRFVSSANDTGAIPIPLLIVGGIVAVTVVVARSYVVMYVAEKASEIVDAALKRNAASKEIQQADAEVMKLVNNHVQREQEVGKTMPLDEATRTAIRNLETRVGSLVKASYESIPTPSFPSWVWPAAGLTAVAVVTAIIVWKRKAA